MTDTLITEIRKHKETLASQFGNDVHAMLEDARKKQKLSKRKVVNFSNKKSSST